MDCGPILATRIGPGVKGLPAMAGDVTVGDIGHLGWHVRDLIAPFAVLRESALVNNGDWMRRFTEAAGVGLCPHGKTTMAPQLFERQLRDGAWGITCATFAHLQVYRRFRVPRVIFANQIVSPAAAEWLARQLAADPAFDCHVFVDSRAGAAVLADAAHRVALDRPIPVLVEIGHAAARSGVRSVASGVELARAIGALSGLCISGVATYEGVLVASGTQGPEGEISLLLDRTVALAEAIDSLGLFSPTVEPILTAGGSKYFDMVTHRFRQARLSRPFQVVLRSGCYVSHDAGDYDAAFNRLRARGVEPRIQGSLENALEIRCDVQSRPEPTLILANAGKRDLSHDSGMPSVLDIAGHDPRQFRVERLSDQHAHIRCPADCAVATGDRISLGVSHPCTTFDKWRILFQIDDEGLVRSAISTFF